METEERALALAHGAADVHAALDFLAHWPALDRAVNLITARAEELDGNAYEVLAPPPTRWRHGIRWPRRSPAGR